jgi:DNA repair protein RadA/Sms
VARVKRLYVCSSCERPASQWSGRCGACGEWGTVSEHPAGASLRAVGSGDGATTAVLTLALGTEEHRTSTGLAAVDRVLGGGLVPGSVVLVAGAPGMGKSTLLLQLASSLARAGHPCLMASGEESHAQVAARARRLGIDGEAVRFIPGRDLGDVVSTATAMRPEILVVDSIQTIRDAGSDALPGGPGQVRGCGDALIGMAKEHEITVVLVGHVTKGGDVAGPRTLEHAVDVVMTFEGDPRSGLRVLSSGKNRYGSEGEVAWFEMTSAGLIERETGPRLEGSGEAGCATTVALAGRRAFAVDVQALVVPVEGPPKRQVTGLDARRFHIVAAVTEQASKLRLTRYELYGASSGGFRMEDPGADLAVASALASAATGRALPRASGLVGELSLTGAIRPVAGIEQRVAAAAAAGLEVLVVPAGAAPLAVPKSLHILPLRHLWEVLRWALPDGRGHEYAL